MAYHEVEDDRAVIHRGLTTPEPTVMPWVEGTAMLPEWMLDMEKRMAQSERVAEDQGRRLLELQERVQLLVGCFERIALRQANGR